MGGFRRRWPLTGSPLSSALARWTQPGFVKNIQTGTIDLNGVNSNTATITSVDTKNSLLFCPGGPSGAGASNSTSPTIYNCTLRLTNATTVTASHAANDANALLVPFLVVEFYPGVIKSVQIGTADPNGGTSATSTITTVNTGKSVVLSLGATSAAGGAGIATNSWRFTLTNATTVTVNIGQNPGASMPCAYQVVEFY